MTMHVNVSGTWKDINEAFVNVSGTNKRIISGWVNVSGTWKQFFAAEAVSLSGTPVSPNLSVLTGASAGTTATWVWASTGKVSKNGVDFGDEWVDTKPPALDYWIRFTHLSGTAATSGDTYNTWHQLAGGTHTLSLSWTYTTGNISGVAKVEIATDSAGSNIVATGYYGADISA